MICNFDQLIFMKPMGLYEFNIMDDNSKAALLWDKGTFIMTRIENSYRIHLYSLFDFFAESADPEILEKFLSPTIMHLTTDLHSGSGYN